MPETASFTTITERALRLTWQGRSLWWSAIPVGICIGIGTHMSTLLQDTLPESTDAALWVPLLTDQRLVIGLALLFLALIAQSLLRGALVFLLEHRLRKTGSSEVVKKPTTLTLLHAAGTSLIFEMVYWLTLLIIAAVFAIPCLFAWRFNPSVLPAILEIGFLLLLTIGVYLYFIKELSLLYGILGNLRFQPATDLGFRLFRRQAWSTTLFFFYAAILALFFSILIEGLVMLFGISKENTSWYTSALIALPFGIYFIFDQALRLTFFHAIAATPKKPITKEIVLEPDKSPSGIAPS